jgi:hypothetical protein
MPRECSCTKTFTFLAYLSPNFIPLFPLQGHRGEEGREEEEEEEEDQPDHAES